MNKKILFTASCTFIVIVLIICGIMYYNLPTSTTTLKYDLIISNNSQNIGFNLDKDKVHFGTVIPGSSAFRTITLKNNENYVQKVEIAFNSLELSHLQYFQVTPPSGTIIPANSAIEFKITYRPSLKLKTGTYEGEIIVYTYRCCPWEK